MKFGDYTGVDDVETLFAMVHDNNLDTETRIPAVLDLSLTEDFDWHRLLDFVQDKSQPSSIRGEIFDKQNWDERSIPVILQAFLEENDEVQFWTAYALADNRYYWKRSQLDKIISILDKLAQNKNIAASMWHLGRETLYPLERAYYRKINSEIFDSVDFRLISPRLEYWDFMQARQKNEAIVEPTLQLDPTWLKEQIQTRFKSAKFGVRRPKAESYLLDWKIGYGKYPLYGALHTDGFGIVLSGKEVSIRRFAEWYRIVISDEHELRLYEWADRGEIL